MTWRALLHCAALATLCAAQCPWQRDVADTIQSACVCSYNLGRELSVQCDQVNWPSLLALLNKHAAQSTIALLYVNNATIVQLQDHLLRPLRIHSIQLSACKIRAVEDAAFSGLDLKMLNLQENLLTSVPKAVKMLSSLQLLDLSRNRISHVVDGTFEVMSQLVTLKLSDMEVRLEGGAFRGLGGSLKNLNLKGTGQTKVPHAVGELRSLAFLDLSQNSLKDLQEGFQGLHSLTALNLERNLLQHLGDEVFVTVSSTLSSLSLLNNLLADFPVGALASLRELRVLDVGFNLFTEMPVGALRNNSMVTLLALDGNPLPTLPHQAFRHLKASLRGLSVGGRFLHCDCRLEWILEWIGEGLQVTSRERNPQFCGSPPELRERTFQSLRPGELACAREEVKKGVATVVDTSLTPPTTTTTSTTRRTTPSLVISRGKPSTSREREVTVKNAFRKDSSVIIQWGSDSANMLGFRVVYRLFGDKSFKQGPPLEASEREFKIKNVPSQECIIVCVISLEETFVTPETVPYRQCREVRTVTSVASNMDKITIAASAAICGTIVVAVVIFIAASRRRSRKLQQYHQQQQQQQLSGMKRPLPVNGLPVNCPIEPIASLANLGAYSANKDWDQVSAYSAHSQRPRVYAAEPPPSVDDVRGHFGGKTKARSIADGQSQHSYSNRSGRYLTANAFPGNLLASRQDLRHSRQSLAMQSERMSTRAPPSHTSRRSRDHHHRPGSRYSASGSMLDGSDNWTDHDMDIYMARNPTTRNGLVPL